MPEAKQVEEDLKNTEKQYQTLIQAKIKDFQDKAAVYEKLPANTSDIIKQDKEKELQNLQTSIQEFQQNAQTSIQKKQAQLLQPIVKKIEENMHLVATENAYTFVFNNYEAGAGASPVLLHFPAEADISDLVLKKMGITPRPAGAAAPAAATPAAAPAAAPAAKPAAPKK